MPLGLIFSYLLSPENPTRDKGLLDVFDTTQGFKK